MAIITYILKSVANKKHFEHSGEDQLLTLWPFWKSINSTFLDIFDKKMDLSYVKL